MKSSWNILMKSRNLKTRNLEMGMIQVTVRSALADRAYLYARNVISEVNTYRGELLPNPRWAKDSICISTNDPQFTFRVINKDRILKMKEL